MIRLNRPDTSKRRVAPLLEPPANPSKLIRVEPDPEQIVVAEGPDPHVEIPPAPLPKVHTDE